MKVLCCGDREWKDRDKIAKELAKLPLGTTTIIHGVARGADKLSEDVGEHECAGWNFEYERYPADWDTYGKAAGPIRNRRMLTEGKPDLVLAFHSNLDKSKGTKDMVMIANKAGVKVIVVP